MTHLLPTEAPRRLGGNGFLRRTWGVLVKEFIWLALRPSSAPGVRAWTCWVVKIERSDVVRP